MQMYAFTSELISQLSFTEQMLHLVNLLHDRHERLFIAYHVEYTQRSQVYPAVKCRLTVGITTHQSHYTQHSTTISARS